MIGEHDRIILTQDLPDLALRAGDIGTVVHVYADAAAFEVEFVTVKGETVDVVTLPAACVREARSDDIPSVRAA